jgi:hypothetical protein
MRVDSVMIAGARVDGRRAQAAHVVEETVASILGDVVRSGQSEIRVGNYVGLGV